MCLFRIFLGISKCVDVCDFFSVPQWDYIIDTVLTHSFVHLIT